MAATITTAITIQKRLFDQVEALAQQRNLTPDELFALAVEHYLSDTAGSSALDGKPATQIGDGPRVINQGDLYWIAVDEASQSELGYYPHPYVVIQDDLLNHSRIHTVVVCGLTSNMREAKAPGNVLLDAGEANLARQSIVVVSRLSTVAKAQLGDYIGTLSPQRIAQIWAGLRFLQSSFFSR